MLFCICHGKKIDIFFLVYYAILVFTIQNLDKKIAYYIRIITNVEGTNNECTEK